jgi:hypothetical protein
MSFTKLTYDDCAYKANLQGNVSHLAYTLDPIRYYNCQKCRPEVGLVGGTAVSHVSGNLVDLESNLFGIDREASKCSGMKYLPRDDNTTQGADHYRARCTNKVDTTMKHLPPCQITNVLGVPHPPTYQPYTCPSLKN